MIPDPTDAPARLVSRVRQLGAAARWTAGALRHVRRALPETGLSTLAPAPPNIRHDAILGVRVMLRVRRATCLERALILQRWFAAHGVRRVLLVGVRTEHGFSAHAWLEGERAPGFLEITRIEPPA